VCVLNYGSTIGGAMLTLIVRPFDGGGGQRDGRPALDGQRGSSVSGACSSQHDDGKAATLVLSLPWL